MEIKLGPTDNRPRNCPMDMAKYQSHPNNQPWLKDITEEMLRDEIASIDGWCENTNDGRKAMHNLQMKLWGAR
jgi:hypothetical protein